MLSRLLAWIGRLWLAAIRLRFSSSVVPSIPPLPLARALVFLVASRRRQRRSRRNVRRTLGGWSGAAADRLSQHRERVRYELYGRQVLGEP